MLLVLAGYQWAVQPGRLLDLSDPFIYCTGTIGRMMEVNVGYCVSTVRYLTLRREGILTIIKETSHPTIL